MLRKGSRTLIYLWDSGKGRGSLGEVLKPRSGVSSVSVIYLEWEKASDRRKKIPLHGGGADHSLGQESLDDLSQGTDSWISLVSPFK